VCIYEQHTHELGGAFLLGSSVVSGAILAAHLQNSPNEFPRTSLLGSSVNRVYAISNRRTAASVKRYGTRPKGNFAAISGGTCSSTVSAPSHTKRHKASS
jgi:hypothetical protein